MSKEHAFFCFVFLFLTNSEVKVHVDKLTWWEKKVIFIY